MASKLTKAEQRLAKRVGQGGTEFVRARRKRPGMSLLEFQALSDADLADLVEGTAPEEPVPAAPVPEPTRTTAAKKTAAKKATGSSGR